MGLCPTRASRAGSPAINLFRHQSYSLVSHVRYVRVARAITCARNFRVVSRAILKLGFWRIPTLSTEAGDALLNDDHDPKEASTTSHQVPMFSLLQNVNKNLPDSILNINQSLKGLHPSNTDHQLDSKRQKYSSKDEMSASDNLLKHIKPKLGAKD